MAKKKTSEQPGYDDYRERQAEISRERSAAGREIGPLPAVADPKRRKRCKGSLLKFARTYFAARFPWKFSDTHEKAGERIDSCSTDGGLFALAMPRGFGKTTMAEVAVIRNAVYGFRRFQLLTQATQPLASRSLKKIQREFETNDLLLADFPEVCFPIRALKRIHHRAKGQTLDGEPTRIEWTADGVVLPTVAGSVASGAAVMVAGLTGAIRGLSMNGPNGEIVRPDMVVLDDCQTRESARSPAQTGERESIVTDDILGLAGPGVTIAALMLCTVIYPGDLSDRFLSPDKHPEWQGIRSRMLTTLPTDLDLWDKYGELRREALRQQDVSDPHGRYYLENKIAMDAGAVASWAECRKKGEHSAIQSGMNIYLTNPRGFWAEYQNEPQVDAGAVGSKELVPAEFGKRLSGLPRYEIPREATKLTAFVDCGGLLHWYCVCAWDRTFGGAVVDYGAWPRQSRSVFAADDPRPSLADVHPKMDEPQRVFAGLAGLTNEILGRTYLREGTGEQIRVERCLIDAGWNSSAVYQFCRSSPFAASIYPSKGIARTTTAAGVGQWKRRPGEVVGYHWRRTMSDTGRGQMIQFDPDMWKSFVYERATTPPGGGGALTLFGDRAGIHEMIAEHCAAESSEPAMSKGTTWDKWGVKPHRPDNHLLDCLVGAAVAASVAGLVYSPTGQSDPAAAPPAGPKMSLLDRYNAKHGKARR